MFGPLLSLQLFTDTDVRANEKLTHETLPLKGVSRETGY